MRRLLVVLLAAAMLAGCTGSQRTTDLDQDRDLAEDADETAGLTITIELLDGPKQRFVTSDTGNPDTDGDGLLDGDELHIRGSDPRDVDTDDDGLLDGEDVPTEGAPVEAWRALGILEIEGLFLGELDACPGADRVLTSTRASSDLPIPDALTDGEELRGWDIVVRGDARHVTSDPCKPDTDGDGLQDHDERTHATDPRQDDTDGDDAADGVDADPLHDLALRFDEATLDDTEAEVARIVLTFGSRTSELRWPGNGTATIDVDDASGDREHLLANGIVEALDAQGRLLAGAILNVDLVEDTLSGAALEGDRLVVTGANATLSLRWSVLRR